jgi:hypothetical protein
MRYEGTQQHIGKEGTQRKAIFPFESFVLKKIVIMTQ